ncbi:MAG: HDOD domain-containing protein, partial [Pseudomonadota bacterium]
AALLDEVAVRHPETARFVLSGHAELEAILRAVRPAHQYFAKPCEPQRIADALRRVAAVRQDPSTGPICLALGAHRRLPSRRVSLGALDSALARSVVCLEEITEIVRGDIAMTVQILRVVHSAFFGLPIATLDPARAIAVLGPDLLTKTFKNVELFRPVENAASDGEFQLDQLHDRIEDVGKELQVSNGACDPEIDPRVVAMLSLSGPLAAIEASGDLNDVSAKSLSRILLSYWGLDTELQPGVSNRADLAGAA